MATIKELEDLLEDYDLNIVKDLYNSYKLVSVGDYNTDKDFSSLQEMYDYLITTTITSTQTAA